jgi:rRNA maturation protein Nop10
MRNWVLPSPKIMDEICKICGHALGTKNVCYRYRDKLEYCHVGCYWEGSDFIPTTKPLSVKDNAPTVGREGIKMKCPKCGHKWKNRIPIRRFQARITDKHGKFMDINMARRSYSDETDVLYEIKQEYDIDYPDKAPHTVDLLTPGIFKNPVYDSSHD